ncbi:MAG TPA: S8 family serine peptidase [Chloroflexia bacterium]|nr:S8 family serine peptidase [Chloroflexia bacterium]
MKAPKFLIAALVGLMALPLASGASPAPGAVNPNNDSSQAASKSANVDSNSALVQLSGAPLATYEKTRPPRGQKIDFNSNDVRNYRAQLNQLRNQFKQWLRANAPAARVTGEFDISLNAVSVELNGTSLDVIRTAPMVVNAQLQGLYYKTDDNDPDLNLINAIEAWAVVGGPADAGDGVKVAVIDSGIDQTHPCFDDTGYPQVQQLGDPRYTNNKVIAAKVFINRHGYTAEAVDSHGTHVAGTIGCNLDTPATVQGVEIPYDISGVAPRALLGNYNVFPGTVESARSEDIVNALEEAYEDGFDVANMSLGGGSHGIQDLLAVVVNNLDEANMVVAIAAGNSGPGHYTVESPGFAERALTAGASSVPHFVGAPVVIGSDTFGGAVGDFETVDADLTAVMEAVGAPGGLSTACTPITDDLTGKIAAVSRGGCTFSTKIRNAENAGAIAALVVNNVAGDPTAMASDGTPNQPTIPAYMLGLEARDEVIAADGTSVTIEANLDYFLTTNANIMAGFSGQGPTDVAWRIKPDVVAPGVNVLSSIPVSYCGGDPCFAFFQGTSMATPHLAGSAAVIRGYHPDWTAAQVRSAIVNTANRDVLKDFQTGTQIVTDVNIIGSGLEDLLAAVETEVVLDPVSISYGQIPAGSGKGRTAEVTLTNTGDATMTYDLAIEDATAGATFSVSSASVELDPGESASVAVSVEVDRGADRGDKQAWLTVSSGGTEIAHMALYVLVR